MVIVAPRCALLQPPGSVHVVLVGVSHTRVVVQMIVTTTSGAGRQGRRSWSKLGHSHVPSHTPNSVRVQVTMPVADVMTTIDSDVRLARCAPSLRWSGPVVVGEVAYGAIRVLLT